MKIPFACTRTPKTVLFIKDRDLLIKNPDLFFKGNKAKK